MDAKKLLKSNENLLEEFAKLSLEEQEKFLSELQKKKKNPPRSNDNYLPQDHGI